MKFYWHIHHGRLWELATEPIEQRRLYIVTHKPTNEQATRLRLLREITGPEIARLAEAWDQYEAVRQPAWDQYEAVRQPAWAQYVAVRQQAWAQYEAVRQQALAQYEAVRQQAWDQYEAVRQQAWDQYVAVRQQALAQYEAVERSIDFVALHRAQCPNCPWDGQTIFPEMEA